MNDYILLMHDDAIDRAVAEDGARWEHYLSGLRASGQFDGGSVVPAPARVNGYIRVRAESLEAAQRFLAGNPDYDAGGTVEVRALPRS
ncbi:MULTISPECIES: hypothetical protein [unclassified Duganella]|uniref:hypothetical protein n=1 Tax=unclassified Duganella TaxID=2636909 RepID=UPI0006FA8B74|nr:MULTISPECIES: hypothetical protein [unclassified Duganella]KQV53912.1 hypothetical protein ASD07_05020 [Duganella sp. Root336D2]KRB83534.1 hypothetical protein ASE26_10160 [Duganella sp. Root198D2]